jgi:hypothetical protein
MIIGILSKNRLIQNLRIEKTEFPRNEKLGFETVLNKN